MNFELEPLSSQTPESTTKPQPQPSRESAKERFKRAVELKADTGYDVEKAQEAFVIFKALSEQGHAPSLNHLGELYRSGYGVEYDAELAEECFRQSAEKGHTNAMINLVKMQKAGEIIASNEEVQLWLTQASEKRNTDAMRLLLEQEQAEKHAKNSAKFKGLLTAIVVIGILPWSVFINSLILPIFASMGLESVKLGILVIVSIAPAVFLLRLIHGSE